MQTSDITFATTRLWPIVIAKSVLRVFSSVIWVMYWFAKPLFALALAARLYCSRESWRADLLAYLHEAPHIGYGSLDSRSAHQAHLGASIR